MVLAFWLILMVLANRIKETSCYRIVQVKYENCLIRLTDIFRALIKNSRKKNLKFKSLFCKQNIEHLN